jgi:hypothetical protein
LSWQLTTGKTEGSEIVEQIMLDAFETQIDLNRLDVFKVEIEGCEERFIAAARGGPRRQSATCQ